MSEDKKTPKGKISKAIKSAKSAISRKGAVKSRSQIQEPSGNYVKRDAQTGRFMDVKTSDKKPFRGVKKEKASWIPKKK